MRPAGAYVAAVRVVAVPVAKALVLAGMLGSGLIGLSLLPLGPVFVGLWLFDSGFNRTGWTWTTVTVVGVFWMFGASIFLGTAYGLWQLFKELGTGNSQTRISSVIQPSPPSDP
jgi:hypothetical protein